VRLDGYDAAYRINVIRAVPEMTGLGLKEALGLVGQAPCVIKERLARDEAEQARAMLEAVGGQRVARVRSRPAGCRTPALPPVAATVLAAASLPGYSNGPCPDLGNGAGSMI
jgi:hypothetical protein